MIESYLDGRVAVKVGDITDEKTDAIVNAANSTLLGGGGVDGAIHRRGGEAILTECRQIRQGKYPGGLPTGEAVPTTAGKLEAKYVIHTVGPIYGMNNGRDAELLAAAYKNSLQLAKELTLQSIAFPSISTGVYAYPKDEAALIVSLAIQEFLESSSYPQQVVLVFFHASDAEMFVKHQVFE